MLPAHLQRFAEPQHVLDDGHVMLVDVLGDEQAIVNAARVSYGAGTKRVSEDRHLLRYLMRHRHCYDDQTEVLTSDGFVPWPDVWQHFRECDKQYDNKCGIRLGIWDPAASTLCYEVPEYITCDPYKGDMYQVDHGGVDLLVTPDHKMWVRLKDQWDASNKSQGWSRFRLLPANELGNRSCVRYSKLAPMVAPMWMGDGFPACNDPQALLELIGFFIGDGSARGTRANGIDFHLKKKREIQFLHECVARVGWPMREFPSYEGRRKFCVYGEGIGHQFEEMFYWNDNKKHLPEWCLRLDRDDAAAILNGMRHSDGSEKRGAWVYYTGSARLAEQVQILGLHAGEACHVSQTDQAEPYDPMFRVTFLSRMREPVVNQGKVQTSMVPYEGNVYCAKTRTGILVVRRNGKIVLSGNTTPFEMCEVVLRVRVPMDCWRQWIRHRTASVNEYSTRYSEAIDSAQKTDPSCWRSQATNNKQGSGDFLRLWAEGFTDFRPGTPEEQETYGSTVGWVGQDFYSSPGSYLTEREAELHRLAREVYEERLKFGVAREQARKDLPLATYTEAYWKCDLHNLLHFLSLRLDPHAQKEIRDYAHAIAEIVKVWLPNVWEAFEDYRLQAVTFSRLELEGLRVILSRLTSNGFQAGKLIEAGIKGACLTGREAEELRAKLITLLG